MIKLLLLKFIYYIYFMLHYKRFINYIIGKKYIEDMHPFFSCKLPCIIKVYFYKIKEFIKKIYLKLW
jgi:hypothetical protein